MSGERRRRRTPGADIPGSVERHGCCGERATGTTRARHWPPRGVRRSKVQPEVFPRLRKRRRRVRPAAVGRRPVLCRHGYLQHETFVQEFALLTGKVRPACAAPGCDAVVTLAVAGISKRWSSLDNPVRDAIKRSKERAKRRATRRSRTGDLLITKPDQGETEKTRTNYPRRKPRIRTDDVFAWCGVVRGGVVAAW